MDRQMQVLIRGLGIALKDREKMSEAVPVLWLLWHKFLVTGHS